MCKALGLCTLDEFIYVIFTKILFQKEKMCCSSSRGIFEFCQRKPQRSKRLYSLKEFLLVEFCPFYGGGRDIFILEEHQAGIYTKSTALLKGNPSASEKQEYIHTYDSAIPLWVIVPKETLPQAPGKPESVVVEGGQLETSGCLSLVYVYKKPQMPTSREGPGSGDVHSNEDRAYRYNTV